jgi:hypothetical protein
MTAVSVDSPACQRQLTAAVAADSVSGHLGYDTIEGPRAPAVKTGRVTQASRVRAVRSSSKEAKTAARRWRSH